MSLTVSDEGGAKVAPRTLVAELATGKIWAFHHKGPHATSDFHLLQLPNMDYIQDEKHVSAIDHCISYGCGCPLLSVSVTCLV